MADKKLNFYRKLFDGKLSFVGEFMKDGVVYLQPQTKEGKPIGRALKKNSRTHAYLLKRFTKFFPIVEGYTFIKGKQKLVKSEKANIISKFKAKDYKRIGFQTRKQGEEYLKELRKKGIIIQNEEQLEALSKGFFKMRDYASQKILNLFRKNLGRIYVKQNPAQYKNFNLSYDVKHIGNRFDLYRYFKDITPFLHEKIDMFMTEVNSCKVQFNLTIMFVKPNPQAKEDDDNIPKTIKIEVIFKSSIHPIINKEQIAQTIHVIRNDIFNKVSKYTKDGSGWIVGKILHGYLNLVRHRLISGSSYFEMSSFIKNKKAVINIKNEDNRCFLYSIITALHYHELDTKHLDRLDQFEKYFKLYPFDDNDMPMTIGICKKIEKYENIIQRNINVIFNEHPKTEITPFYKSSNTYEETINLMLCHDEGYGKNHFVWVRDMSRLLSSSISKHTRKMHFCMRCLSHFSKESELQKHEELCKNNEVSKIEMPKDNLKFTNVFKQLKLPFVVYADFETLPMKIEEKKGDKTQRIMKHVVCGGEYIIVSNIEKKVIKSFKYRGDNCVRHFIDSLNEDCEELYMRYFYREKPMVMTKEDKINFENSNVCHICGKDDFTSDDEISDAFEEYMSLPKNTEEEQNIRRKCYRNIKTLYNKKCVRDHCHFTGNYRGKAHSKCNLDYQVRPTFPILFHNLKGFDSNFIIKEIRKEDCDEISVIPLNREKFISFSMKHRVMKLTKKGKEIQRWMEMRFIDSLAFLSSSLETLAKNLDVKDFKHCMRFLREQTPYAETIHERFSLFNLINQKGVYPYEYMDNWDKFEETQLPHKHKFISKLQHETNNFYSLSDKQKSELERDYLHAKLVFDKFKCKNIGDYHDLYLDMDVHLLADIFEKFREISLNKFGLDPCHYYTISSLSWDAMLKITGVELYLFKEHEKDMYLFLEKAKIGGISGTCGKRYAKANNKYMKDFDKSKKSNYIIYGDANGLYSWAMTQLLPFDKFEWVNIDDFDLEKELQNCDGEFSCFIEGDFHIPDELHDEMNDYCPFPENLVVKDEMLSEYQKNTRKSISIVSNEREVECNVPKLIPNLMPKKNYIIHAKTLKLFLKLGCKVDKIHRVLKFRQSEWMKPYIDLCMNERKKADSSFERDFWKLCCNAIYGKSLENVRNRIDVKLTTSVHQAQKWVDLPRFDKGQGIVNINEDGLMMIDLAKKTIKLDKPIYAGIAILNLSKYLMYDFWYNVLRKKYNDAKLLYTDTDSFMFEIFTEDFYKDLLNDEKFLDEWDLSNYSSSHPMFEGMDKREVQRIIMKNKKIVGRFKDECAGECIKEYVGLRAKCYSLLLDNQEQKNTGKGVKKQILKRTSHDRYKDCIFHNNDSTKMVVQAEMNFIRSENHSVYNETIRKVALSSYDDKKFIVNDGITQLSYGHWRITEKIKKQI